MADDRDLPVVIVEKESGSGVGGFLLGLLAGAAAGILFAPQSGEETQRELREGAEKLRGDAEEKLADLRAELSDVYDRARDDVADRVDTARREMEDRSRKAREAIRAGKSAARSARSDLEQRVEESKRAYKESVAAGATAGSGDEAGADEGDQEA